MKKSQTTLIAIVLIIVVFGVVVMFLSSFEEFHSHGDYLNLYTKNTLISILRTDTGYINFPESCGRVIDVLFCSEFTPSFRCGEIECRSLVNALVDAHVSKLLKPQMDYLLKYGDDKKIGNPDVEMEEERFIASEDFRKGNMKLRVTLIMTEK